MIRILVTGADGQLGRELKEVAGSAPIAGHGRDVATEITGKNIGGFEWIFAGRVDLDITDSAAVRSFFADRKLDAVVNCAAFRDVDPAETNPEAAFRVNRDAVRFLAEACRDSGAALVHISTDFVFDGRDPDSGPNRKGDGREKDTADFRPYTEEDATAPLNVYGESKLAGEEAVTKSGVKGAVIRTSWLYSPWGRNFVTSILAAAQAAEKAAAGKTPELRVVTDQWSCPTSAAGLARAIVEMIPTLISSVGSAEILHYCDAGVVSRAGFAAEIIRLAGLPTKVVPVTSAAYSAAPTSPGSKIARRPAFSALDTTKIAKEFGIVPPPWREALQKCINRIRNGR